MFQGKLLLIKVYIQNSVTRDHPSIPHEQTLTDRNEILRRIANWYAATKYDSI